MKLKGTIAGESASLSVINISIQLPLYLRSEANRRDHHLAKAKRVKEQRGVVGMMLRASADLVRLAGEIPLDITITRIHKRSARPLDDDNLRSACKAVRDGVADALQVDDANPRLQWLYGQEPATDYAVRITISSREVRQ